MSGFGPGPLFKIQPPRRVEAAIERPRLMDDLSVAADSHRLILVEAPAGYGKSTFLSDWVRRTTLPSAWLTLDRFDARPDRLFRGIVAAIQATAATTFPAMNEVLLDPAPDLIHDEAASYDHLLGALELLEEPLAVVLDDVHLAGPGLVDGIVGVLARSAPAALRLILSGRDHSSLRLERLRYSGGLAEFRTGELAFTLLEARQLAEGVGRVPDLDVDEIWAATAGWPVAVHAAFLGIPLGSVKSEGAGAMSGPQRGFGDYIAEEVLSQLDPSLAEFVLHSTTCDWLERGLAIELSGLPTAGILLQECLRRGLFLEETEFGEEEAVYHWQPLFAAQCRGILEYRNPVLAEHLHRVAARYYQDFDVSESVGQAFLGRDLHQAVEALGDHWFDYLLRNGLYPLEKLCLNLTAPWADDPEVLMIKSLCRALAGDISSAKDLTGRALAGVEAVDPARQRKFELYVDLLGLMPEVFSSPWPRAVEHLAATGIGPGNATELSGDLILPGQVQIREQAPRQPTGLVFPTAPALVHANQATAEENAVSASLIALAYAAAGDLIGAKKHAAKALEGTPGPGCGAEGWLDEAWLARGITCYWVDDLGGARSHLEKVQLEENGVNSVARLCAFYRVLIDCAAGDPIRVDSTATALSLPRNRGLYGRSWHSFSLMARAKLAEASGDLGSALAIVRPLGVGGHPPLVDTFLAELLRRGGNSADALRCTQCLPESQRSSYTGTSMALTEALLASETGDMATAHERIEHAISLAGPQGILRPFAERQDELSGLLIQHAVWGTAHEAFVATLMTQNTHDDSLTTFLYWSLTERELEVLTYMRSMMTTADIGNALFISVNTVKTHQRSIYRKLGAASRRDALKIAAARGII